MDAKGGELRLVELFEPDKEKQVEAIVNAAMRVVVASNVANQALYDLQHSLEDYLQKHWVNWNI